MLWPNTQPARPGFAPGEPAPGTGLPQPPRPQLPPPPVTQRVHPARQLGLVGGKRAVSAAAKLRAKAGGGTGQHLRRQQPVPNGTQPVSPTAAPGTPTGPVAPVTATQRQVPGQALGISTNASDVVNGAMGLV